MTSAFLPLASNQPSPTAMPEATIDNNRVEVHVSHYTPWTGGPNCSRFVNGECLAKMASGFDWRDYVDQGSGGAAACVAGWPFGLQFKTQDGRVWTCQDRGGAIVVAADGRPWVDLLTDNPGAAYGAVVTVEVLQ